MNFHHRIKALAEHIPAQACIILTAHVPMQKAADITYPFTQESNFLYLTGIDEAGWRLLIHGQTGESVLFSPTRSEIERIFDGMSDSTNIHGAFTGTIVSEEKFQQYLLSANFTEVYIPTEGSNPTTSHFHANPARKQDITLLKKLGFPVKLLAGPLSKMRALKDASEMKCIQNAVAVTLSSFEALRTQMSNIPYSFEYELEAEFTYAFRKKNARHAYEPIVASGKNALTLHYTKNSDPLPKNGLVLIDIGAQVNGYNADITRTYAVGTPSEREIAVHAAVEKAHFAIIDLIKPGVALSEYQAKSDEIMKEALKSLGLLKKPEDYRKYFPHAISHGLGIDVHESLSGYKEFMPGMVLTVEPGIYIPEEGIGVRIEDDILVTKDGNENLSAHLPTSL